MDAIETTVDLAPAAAEAAIRVALEEQGFGVITEIDVASVLKAKLGIDRSFLKILGACNPGFAHRALELNPSVALLLPCNVVVEATAAGTKVSADRPDRADERPRFRLAGRRGVRQVEGSRRGIERSRLTAIGRQRHRCRRRAKRHEGVPAPTRTSSAAE